MADTPEVVVMEQASSTTSPVAAEHEEGEEKSDETPTPPANPCVVCNRDATACSPKFLNCFHTVCSSCFNLNDGDVMDCPKCGIQTKEEELEDNFLITRDQFKCPNCKAPNIPVVHCVQCNENLCKKCQEFHKRVTITRNHTFEAIRDIAPGNSRTLSLGVCPKHPEKNVKTFCILCNCWTCHTCQIVDHRDHKYKLLDEKRAEIVEECQKVGKDNRLNMEQLEQMQNKLETVVEGNRSRRRDMQQRLAQKRDALLEIFTTRMAQLEQEVDESMNKQDAVVTELQQEVSKAVQFLRQSTQVAESIPEKADDHHLLIQFYSLLTRHQRHLQGIQMEEKTEAVAHIPDSPTVDLFFANTEHLERSISQLGAVKSTQAKEMSLPNSSSTPDNRLQSPKNQNDPTQSQSSQGIDQEKLLKARDLLVHLSEGNAMATGLLGRYLRAELHVGEYIRQLQVMHKSENDGKFLGVLEKLTQPLRQAWLGGQLEFPGVVPPLSVLTPTRRSTDRPTPVQQANSLSGRTETTQFRGRLQSLLEQRLLGTPLSMEQIVALTEQLMRQLEFELPKEEVSQLLCDVLRALNVSQIRIGSILHYTLSSRTPQQTPPMLHQETPTSSVQTLSVGGSRGFLKRTGPLAVPNEAAVVANQLETESEPEPDGEDDCAVCGKEEGEGEQDMQPVCARCDRGIHLSCHIPRLLCYPFEDHWICRGCEGVEEMKNRVRDPLKLNQMLCEQLLLSVYRIPKMRRHHYRLDQLKTMLADGNDPNVILQRFSLLLNGLDQNAGTREAKEKLNQFLQKQVAAPAAKRPRF